MLIRNAYVSHGLFMIDDVGAVVVEIGSSEVYAGYAGEDVPSCIFPSMAGFVPHQETDSVIALYTVTFFSALACLLLNNIFLFLGTGRPPNRWTWIKPPAQSQRVDISWVTPK